MSVELQEISVEDSIKAAMTEIEDKTNDNEPEEDRDTQISEEPVVEKSGRDRDESGKFVKQAKEKTEKPEEKAEDKVEEIKAKPEAKSDAPQSLPAALKDQWVSVPAPVREWLAKREADQHQMFTRHDGELNLGRKMKEVITPYMPIIHAEGGTPEAAVQSLLNTAYQLRTSTPAQKAALIGQICQQYGVDLSQVNPSQSQLPPEVQSLKNELDQVKNDLTKEKQLQEQEKQNKIISEINAFAADPKNIYFEQLKPEIGSLMGSGKFETLQEAYDAACWANPQIRSSLIAAQEVAQAEKRKAELAKKKQAAVSVTGSPGVNAPSSTTPKNRSVEDDIREAMDDVLGSKI